MSRKPKCDADLPVVKNMKTVQYENIIIAEVVNLNTRSTLTLL